MLGQTILTPYKTAEDFRSPADYLNFMFGTKAGVFARGRIDADGIYHESFVYKENMTKRKWKGMVDGYISQNSFLTIRKKDTPNSGRCKENLKRLNALYVDIDCYKIGCSQSEVLYILYESYFDRKIPMPTFVIDSGRGLYLIWKIDEDRNAWPRWQAAENYLADQLADLGADFAARDAARVLRVPFTINSKNGKSVRILRFTNVQYTVHEIISEYDIPPIKPSRPERRHIRPDGLLSHPYGEATERQRKAARWIATVLGEPLPDFTNFAETADYIEKYLPLANERKTANESKPLNLANRVSIRAILAGRMADLRQLHRIRKGEDCKREYSLFLYRCWALALYNDPARALEETLLFNSQLDRPFDDTYVIKATASAERKFKDGGYNYSTKTIITELELTAAEQAEMKYLCGYSADAKERKCATNRRAYLSRLEKEGKETKQEAISNRRHKIAAMLAEGKDKVAICHALNLSGRTFDRDKAAIIAEGLVEKIKKAAEEAAQAVMDTIATTAKTVVAVSAYAAAVRGGSPIFQPTYYTPGTSSACTAMALDDFLILSGRGRGP